MSDQQGSHEAATPASQSTKDANASPPIHRHTSLRKSIRRRAWDFSSMSPGSPFRHLTTPARRAWRTSPSAIASKDQVQPESSSSRSSLQEIQPNPTRTALIAHSSDDIIGWIYSVKQKAKGILKSEVEQEKEFYERLERDRKLVEAHHEVDSEAFAKLKMILENNENQKKQLASEREQDDEEYESDELYHSLQPSHLDQPETIGSESDEEYVEDLFNEYEGHYDDEAVDEQAVGEELSSPIAVQYVEEEIPEPNDSEVIDLSDDDEEDEDNIRYDPSIFKDDSVPYEVTPQYRSMYTNSEPVAADQSDAAGSQDYDSIGSYDEEISSDGLSEPSYSVRIQGDNIEGYSDIEEIEFDGIEDDEGEIGQHSGEEEELDDEDEDDEVQHERSKDHPGKLGDAYVNDFQGQYEQHYQEAAVSGDEQQTLDRGEQFDDNMNLFSSRNFELLASAAIGTIEQQVGNLEANLEGSVVPDQVMMPFDEEKSIESAGETDESITEQIGHTYGHVQAGSNIDALSDAVLAGDHSQSVAARTDDVSHSPPIEGAPHDSMTPNEVSKGANDDYLEVISDISVGNNDEHEESYEESAETAKEPTPEPVRYFDSDNDEYESPQHTVFGDLTEHDLSVLQSDQEVDSNEGNSPVVASANILDQPAECNDEAVSVSEGGNVINLEEGRQSDESDDSEIEQQSFVSFFGSALLQQEKSTFSLADASKEFTESLSSPKSKSREAQSTPELTDINANANLISTLSTAAMGEDAMPEQMPEADIQDFLCDEDVAAKAGDSADDAVDAPATASEEKNDTEASEITDDHKTHRPTVFERVLGAATDFEENALGETTEDFVTSLENGLEEGLRESTPLVSAALYNASAVIEDVEKQTLGESAEDFADAVEAGVAENVRKGLPSPTHFTNSIKSAQDELKNETLGETTEAFVTSLEAGLTEIGHAVGGVIEAAETFSSSIVATTTEEQDDLIADAEESVLDQVTEVGNEMFETALGQTVLEMITAMDDLAGETSHQSHGDLLDHEIKATAKSDLLHSNEAEDASSSELSLDASTPVKSRPSVISTKPESRFQNVVTAEDIDSEHDIEVSREEDTPLNVEKRENDKAAESEDLMKHYIGDATTTLNTASRAAQDAMEDAVGTVVEAVDALVDAPVDVSEASDKTEGNVSNQEDVLSRVASRVVNEARDAGSVAGALITKTFDAPDETRDNGFIQDEIDSVITRATSNIISEATNVSRAASLFYNEAFPSPDDTENPTTEDNLKEPISQENHPDQSEGHEQETGSDTISPSVDDNTVSLLMSTALADAETISNTQSDEASGPSEKSSMLKRGWNYVRGWTSSKRSKKNNDDYIIISRTESIVGAVPAQVSSKVLSSDCDIKTQDAPTKSDDGSQLTTPRRKKVKTEHVSPTTEHHIVMRTRSGKIIGANTEEEIELAKQREAAEDEEFLSAAATRHELRDLVPHNLVEPEIVATTLSVRATADGDSEDDNDENNDTVIESHEVIDTVENKDDDAPRKETTPESVIADGDQRSDNTEKSYSDDDDEKVKPTAPVVPIKKTITRRSVRKKSQEVKNAEVADHEDTSSAPVASEDPVTEEPQRTLRRSSRRRTKSSKVEEAEPDAEQGEEHTRGRRGRSNARGDVKNGRVSKASQSGSRKREPSSTARKGRSKTK